MPNMNNIPFEFAAKVMLKENTLPCLTVAPGCGAMRRGIGLPAKGAL